MVQSWSDTLASLHRNLWMLVAFKEMRGACSHLRKPDEDARAEGLMVWAEARRVPPKSRSHVGTFLETLHVGALSWPITDSLLHTVLRNGHPAVCCALLRMLSSWYVYKSESATEEFWAQERGAIGLLLQQPDSAGSTILQFILRTLLGTTKQSSPEERAALLACLEVIASMPAAVRGFACGTHLMIEGARDVWAHTPDEEKRLIRAAVGAIISASGDQLVSWCFGDVYWRARKLRGIEMADFTHGVITELDATVLAALLDCTETTALGIIFDGSALTATVEGILVPALVTHGLRMHDTRLDMPHPDLSAFSLSEEYMTLLCNSVAERVSDGLTTLKLHPGCTLPVSQLGSGAGDDDAPVLNVSLQGAIDLDLRIVSVLLPTNSVLQSLSLDDNRIGSEGLSLLLIGLQQNTMVTRLSLMKSGIGPAAAALLADFLIPNGCVLEELNLNFNQLSSQGVAALGVALAFNTSLRLLQIASCGAGAEGAIALASGLKINTTLKTLDLGANAVHAEGGALIGEALSTCSVENLDMCMNALAVSELAAGDSANAFQAIALSLEKDCPLKLLILNGDPQRMDASRGLPRGCGTMLGAALAKNTHLQELRVDMNEDFFKEETTGEYEAGNFAPLAAGLASNATLTALSLNGVEIDGKGLAEIFGGLKNGSGLVTFSANLSAKGLGEGLVALIEALPSIRHLKSVSLACGEDCDVIAEDLLMKAGTLTGFGPLENLDLRGVLFASLDDTGRMHGLAKAMAQSSLKMFCGVPLDALRADSLVDANFTNRDFGPLEVLILAELIPTCSKLRKLDLSGNTMIGMLSLYYAGHIRQVAAARGEEFLLRLPDGL